MRARLKHLPLLLSVVAGIASAAFLPRRDEHSGAWTKEYLAKRLQEIGYKTHWEGPGSDYAYCQGLYVARQGDPRDWPELVSKRPRSRPQKYWRGIVVIQRDIFAECVSGWVETDPNEIRTHGLVFYGDAEELARIAAHLQR